MKTELLILHCRPVFCFLSGRQYIMKCIKHMLDYSSWSMSVSVCSCRCVCTCVCVWTQHVSSNQSVYFPNKLLAKEMVKADNHTSTIMITMTQPLGHTNVLHSWTLFALLTGKRCKGVGRERTLENKSKTIQSKTQIIQVKMYKNELHIKEVYSPSSSKQ